MASQLAFRLSRGVENTSRPPIPQAYKWAEAYVSTADRPLLDMSQGVPGIPPPKELLDALAVESASPSNCGYIPHAGELVLRQAVVEEMKQSYGKDADITPDDLVITAGCNLAFVTVIMALADADDEVILPSPWYFNNEMTLTMMNIQPVLLKTLAEDGFLPSPERCAALITPKTKAIVLVSPNNPTGAVYPPSLIRAFADIAQSHNIAFILDETYRDFITTGAPHALFTPTPTWAWRNTFIHLYSFSKAYCIPGHRLGLLCASPALLPALTTVLDSLQICAPRPPQCALASLLPALRPFVHATAAAVARRHALFRAALPPRWLIGAQGGYYAFVRHPFARVSADTVCRRLAQERGVVCLPVGFFGPKAGEGEDGVGDEARWIRFSVANVDDAQVALVCGRLAESERVFGYALD
ncbi:pyridoxal phosphate-dependent transferase [Amylocystis lapponica]|nr:pyridoxal phosphate-dependent transferase [Amylocystis lapponica]